jgi:cytochrome c oxidase subunit 1
MSDERNPSYPIDGPHAGPAVHDALAKTWSDPPGFIGVLCAVGSS